MRAPIARVRQCQQRLDETAERMRLASDRELRRRRDGLERSAAVLGGLGPLNVLRRGYSITTLAETGRALRSPDEAPAGSTLRTILRDGQLESTVR